jgi:hypothetical protein
VGDIQAGGITLLSAFAPSAMASSHAVSHRKAFDSGGGGRAGTCQVISTMVSLRRCRESDPLAAGNKL